MKLEIRDRFQRELTSRGFIGPMAPHGTMILNDEYLSSVAVGELMVQLVLRRQKIFRLANVVGRHEATKGYNDLSAAIEALQVIVEAVELPT